MGAHLFSGVWAGESQTQLN